jgi:hypothetical protein
MAALTGGGNGGEWDKQLLIISCTFLAHTGAEMQTIDPNGLHVRHGRSDLPKK